jgi:hypothetical protein
MLGCPPVSYIRSSALVSVKKVDELVYRLEIFFNATWDVCVREGKRETEIERNIRSPSLSIVQYKSIPNKSGSLPN